MEKPTTKDRIISCVLELMLVHDPLSISMRQVADSSGIQQSVIYHYFADKNELLKAAFLSAQQQIRTALEVLPNVTDLHDMLWQRIKYQLDNGHLIIPMLRYFMSFKSVRPGQPGGFIPPQAYRHIREVIEKGLESGDYQTADAEADARIIVHAVNGFLLEYYPNLEANQMQLIGSIQDFIERALRKEEPATN